MKNWTPKDVMAGILTIAVFYSLSAAVTGMLYVPTNEWNRPIREQMIGLLDTIAGGIIFYLGGKLNNNNDSDRKEK